MSSTTIQTAFTKELLWFLESQGYTHILSLGADATENTPAGGQDNYRLLPLKPGDPRLSYEETDYIIEPIDGNDVIDMAAGDEFICFMIEVPIQEFTIFKKIN